LDRIVVEPIHTLVVPVIDAGFGFTVSVADRTHPVLVCEYLITVLPGKNALTSPVPEPIVAIEVLPLLHVPLVVALVSVIVDPAHTANDPPITAGIGNTVTERVDEQPVDNV
jgi:hypothetical protein